jgi:excinuclease ABC subunit A
VIAGTPEDVVAHAQAERRQHGGGSGSSAKKAGEAMLRSYTGEVLDPILAAGPHKKRVFHDFAAEEEKREGDLKIQEVGGEAQMPWEIDGPRWHTVDRVGRTGNPCRWDGHIQADVVERIEDSDLFSPTDWSGRSVVEIRAAKKSQGWFFHAITGEEWLLKMKFRTAKSTFQRDEIVRRLDLKPLNEMADLPLYGTEQRVKCKNLRGPWQEIELRMHGYNEVDRPEFWDFVDQAIAGFGKFTDRVSQNPENLMPWKALGRKWHLSRRGFAIGRETEWDTDVLEELFELLIETAPGGQLLWNNKQSVPLYLPEQKDPWAAVLTKKTDAVHLVLTGPKDRFALGQLTALGHDPELDAERPDHDLIRLKFRSHDDLNRGDLPGLLQEHLKSLRENE